PPWFVDLRISAWEEKLAAAMQAPEAEQETLAIPGILRLGIARDHRVPESWVTQMSPVDGAFGDGWTRDRSELRIWHEARCPPSSRVRSPEDDTVAEVAGEPGDVADRR